MKLTKEDHKTLEMLNRFNHNERTYTDREIKDFTGIRLELIKSAKATSGIQGTFGG